MPITTDVVNSNPAQGDVYSIQHYVIKFVSDFVAGRWLSPGPTVSPTIKTDCHDITEILLKVESYNFTKRTQTNEKRKNASHERYEKYTKRTHDTRTNYTENANERTHDTRNERTIHERTNHWSVTIYYPMTNDPGSIELQYSIVLLFE